ncbi:helicase HerA domain-containing protein [Actinoplanes sp. TFC3]|uniref:helicase HerA domain-containing protein n=1 Tax=Actinoplanes sp. TFC3 TaxID=1710355 RepID=UPI0008376F6D|nr:DUF87 domain-containing protein [Actinoplanes sp. TFC3]
MTEDNLKALTGLRISLAPTQDDVWRRSAFHVDTLHREVAGAVLDAIDEARQSDAPSPIGLVVQGQRGSGKTHLLGWVREQVQRQDGYFFLVGLQDGTSFWQNVAHSMLDGLTRRVEGHETQLRVLLRRLTLLTGVPFDARQALIGDAPLDRNAVEALLKALHEFDPSVASACRHTARALAIFNAGDYRAREVGNNFLLSDEECEPGERGPWALPRRAYPAELIVSEISRLLALTGPSVIAVDQIDGLLAPVSKAMLSNTDPASRDAVMLDRVANGLMDLRERTRRTLTVVSAQHSTWEVIRTKAIAAVQDRFVAKQHLGRIPSAGIGRALIAKRLTPHYESLDFTPPYATWPIRDDAFEQAIGFMPRELLKMVATHIAQCVQNGNVRELTTLEPSSDEEMPPPPPAAPAALTALDTRFAELKANADISRVLSRDTEDVELPALLAAGLQAWMTERGEAGAAFEQDPPPSTKPALHARLRRTLDDTTEVEAHWGFRGISPDYHATAVLNRVRTACTEAGLASGVPNRHLFLLRNKDWPSTPKNIEAVALFEAAGGQRLEVTDTELRVLWALRDLLAKSSADLPAWLLSRQPTSEVAFLRDALSNAGPPPEPQAVSSGSSRPAFDSTPAPDTSSGSLQPVSGSSPTPAASSQRPPAESAPVSSVLPGGSSAPASSWSPDSASSSAPFSSSPSPAPLPPLTPPPSTTSLPAASTSFSPAPSLDEPASRSPEQTWSTPTSSSTVSDAFVLGRRYDTEEPITVELEALRKHMAIFAGSGSGKTVLLRRVIEECALRGVSAIVLDPNNDLARLGDAWPEPPTGWEDGDKARAKEYLENTDVVIYTPRRASGRPLTFQPLPVFSELLDDSDEFEAAVDAALATLAPRAKVDGKTAKAERGRAVLKEALTYYAQRSREATLRGFVGMLDDLPEAASSLGETAPKVATELAQALTAAMVIDPLFGGVGTPVDPGELLKALPGKRARVSVISLVGLPNDDQRQSFVNQLQMALFAWVKKNPAGDRPLGGLFVMDEAQTLAPSGAMTACTRSTLSLASQARKYGLGLVFATQSPKGLHNQIPGNAATQVYGLMNAPAQIDAAREMARAKGGDVPDISQLRSGQFYLALEGRSFAKARTPLCLSFHPRSPLTVEEVLTRSRVTPDSRPT